MNFGLRLDKILADVKAHSILVAAEDSVTGYDIYADPESALVRAKQAITSLIKELVAEAKPMVTSKEVIETYLQNGMTQKAAEYHGRNHAIEQFEQNLLKELEEK